MYILQLQNITKKYPGVVALNDVSLDEIKGEVHALIGENGAGKSTLIKTCTGAVVPDQGKVIIEGKEFSSLTPTSSKENGIAVIYQEFNLVGELSVAENIFLGRAIRKGLVIDNKAMVKESAAIFKQFDINIDPNALVSTLTVGYQQLVEIANSPATRRSISRRVPRSRRIRSSGRRRRRSASSRRKCRRSDNPARRNYRSVRR